MRFDVVCVGVFLCFLYPLLLHCFSFISYVSFSFLCFCFFCFVFFSSSCFAFAFQYKPVRPVLWLRPVLIHCLLQHPFSTFAILSRWDAHTEWRSSRTPRCMTAKASLCSVISKFKLTLEAAQAYSFPFTACVCVCVWERNTRNRGETDRHAPSMRNARCRPLRIVFSAPTTAPCVCAITPNICSARAHSPEWSKIFERDDYLSPESTGHQHRHLFNLFFLQVSFCRLWQGGLKIKIN